ncbi:MAG: hypothetical protein Tsb0013_04020 [Phycisphaerales bacterium]
MPRGVNALPGEVAMGLMVYGICRTGSVDTSDLPRGCDGRPVYQVCTERTAALFSEGHDPKPRASASEFEAFDGVIESAHRQGPILPVRYGTLFQHDGLLTRAVRHADDRLVRELLKVDGMSELTLTLRRAARVVTRVTQVASRVPAGVHTDGTGALALGRGSGGGGARKAPPASGDGEALALLMRRDLADLHALAEAISIDDVHPIEGGAVMHCLLRTNTINLFRTAFEDLRDELGFEGRLGAPSPCYHFATQTLG